MKASLKAYEIVKEFEGLRLMPYQDIVGVWTVGYGSTTDVTPGEKITQAEADDRLAKDMDEAERCLNNNVSVELNQNQIDALCSWIFNLGCKRFHASTMLRKINEGQFDQASVEMRKWDMAGGKQVDWLIKRRIAESKLFETKT